MINTAGRPPMAHRIKIDRPYEPSFDTDIRRTFERERARLAREAFARGELPQEMRDLPPRDEVFLLSRRHLFGVPFIQPRDAALFNLF